MKTADAVAILDELDRQGRAAFTPAELRSVKQWKHGLTQVLRNCARFWIVMAQLCRFGEAPEAAISLVTAQAHHRHGAALWLERQFQEQIAGTSCKARLF